MRHVLKPNNKIVLSMSCECGHNQIIARYELCWRLSEGSVSDSGTGYPTELELVCPECKSTLEVLG